jgi:hypothetical protein
MLALRSGKDTLFSCTTYFDFEKQDKWAAFCRAMDSLAAQHDEGSLGRIRRCLIVNEWSAQPKRDWAAAVAAKYPFATFVQKPRGQKGQATSMNLILDELCNGGPYKLWIHWEETWYCSAPCLDRMFDIMDADASITQLQATRLKGQANWLDSKNPKEARETGAGTKYVVIKPTAATREYAQKGVGEWSNEFFPNWPLYSLLPSINRAELYRRVGSFSTDPALWPIKFEWDFGRRWLLGGGTKAVLPDGPVVRDEGAHKSTYS